MRPPPFSYASTTWEIPRDHLTDHRLSETVGSSYAYPWRGLPQATPLAILPSASAFLTTMRGRPVSTAPASLSPFIALLTATRLAPTIRASSALLGKTQKAVLARGSGGDTIPRP